MGQMVSPGHLDAGHEALVCQIGEPKVGPVEVLRANPAEVLDPGESGLVPAAWVEGRHVAVQSSHDLDDREALRFAVLGKGSYLLGPLEAFAQAHPPGVAKPEERRAVGMLEMPPVACNADRPVPIERVVALVGNDFYLTGHLVQALIVTRCAGRDGGVNPELG